MYRIASLVFILLLTSCSLYEDKPQPDTHPNLSNRDIKLISIIGDLPVPPKEYEWTVYKGLAFLKPIFWRSYKNNKIYVSTPLPLTQEGQYESGISVRTIRHIKSQNGISADKAALRLINIIDKKKTTKRLIFSKDFTKKVKLLRYRYQDNSNPKAPFIVHMHFLIDNEQSYINIFDYKAPVKNWDYTWKTRALFIFNNLRPVEFLE